MSTEKILQGGLLDTDVEMIINNKQAKGSYTYDITISSPVADHHVELLKNVTWIRDFNSSYAEDLRVIFTLDGAIYRDYFHNYQDHLEVTINKMNGSYIVDSTRYKMVILTNSATGKRDTIDYLTSQQLSSFVPIDIEAQCIDLDYYSLVDINIEGTYKNQNMVNVISTEFLDSLKRIDYGSGVPDLNIDIVQPDNTNTYGHVLIPTGTKLINLPTYLQNGDNYGVYNGGMGTFIQKFNKKKYIYVYPLNDVKQYERREDKLMIVHSRDNRVGSAGPTYLVDGKVTKIIPKFDYQQIENGQKDIMQYGNALSYGNPDNIYKSYRKIDNGNTLKGSSKTNVKTISTKNMKDGSNRTTYVGTSNNMYRYRSSTILNTLSIYRFDWVESDIDLIYPGMPCVFLMEHAKQGIIKLYGNVQSVSQAYANDHKETHGTINVAVMNPETYMDMEEYDTNLRTK